MAIHKNANWILNEPAASFEECKMAVLMDLRDELQLMNIEMKRLNALFCCKNFLQIPMILRSIRRNTVKKRRSVV